MRVGEGESTQTATLIQDHWQLYFKGNSQNCDTALHNCREPILFLDTMPKMIKGIARKGPHLNEMRLQGKRKMQLLSGVPSAHLHKAAEAQYRVLPPSDMTQALPRLKPSEKHLISNTEMHTFQHLQSHMHPS